MARGNRGRVATRRAWQKKKRRSPTWKRRKAAVLARIEARKCGWTYGGKDASTTSAPKPELRVAVRDQQYRDFPCPHCNNYVCTEKPLGRLTCNECGEQFRGVDKAEDAVEPTPAAQPSPQPTPTSEPELLVAVLDVVRQVMICPHCQFRMTGVQRARKKKRCPNCDEHFRAVRP